MNQVHLNTKGEISMCTIISIINNKGGVGKTSSTGFLAELLAYLQQNTLVVDLDQQSNISMMLGHYIEDSDDVIQGISAPSEPNIAELFKYRYRDYANVKSLIYSTSIKHLDILPASSRHKNTPTIIAANETGNNNIILKKALMAVKEDYDFILIDNAPANDVLTVNSMFVSDWIYIPVRLEGFSYAGLKETIKTIQYIKEEHDIDTVQFGGTFLTHVEERTNIFKDLSESYEAELQNKFFKTHIRKDIKVSEVETTYRPILEYCPNTNAVFDYANLLLEMHILPESAQKLLAQSIGA